MATAVRAKLTQASFPFNFQEIAATVLVGQATDQNLQTGGEQVAAEVPQAFFLQNMLPEQRGFASVHYSRVVSEHTYPRYLERVYTILDAQGRVALYAPVADFALIYSAATQSWVKFASPTGQVSTAYLKGTTYVCITGAGLYAYDFDLQTFSVLAVSGISSFDSILGVVAVNQYLVLYTAEAVYYSSPTNPLEFTPSPGGPGTSGILALRGQIVTVLAINDGAIVYTTKAAISMLYTGNPNLPFSFRGIKGSAGVSSEEHVSYNTTLGEHIAWTSNGFMQVSQQQAQLVWPELSDSVAAGIFSTLGANNYPVLQGKQQLAVKVSSVGTRYILISVKDSSSGVLEYPHAYVYDTSLDRWGRIDIPHVDIFEYSKPEFVSAFTYDSLNSLSYDDLASKTYGDLREVLAGKAAQFGTTFGVVNKLGAVFIALNPLTASLATIEDLDSGAATPLICLGRYRVIRPNAVCLQEIQITNQATDTTVQWNAHDLSGDMFGVLSPFKNPRNRGQYNGRLSGAHVSITLMGRMLLTALEFILTDAGSTRQPVRPTDGAITLPDGIVTDRTVPVTSDGVYVISL